jgi:hypothetical protein
MISKAVVEQRGLHVHVERAGHDYVLVIIETAGDGVVAEHRLIIEWAEIDDACASAS